jgi:hypothetical protein
MRHKYTVQTQYDYGTNVTGFSNTEKLKPSIIIDQSIAYMIVKNARHTGFIVGEPAFLRSCDRTQGRQPLLIILGQFSKQH